LARRDKASLGLARLGTARRGKARKISLAVVFYCGILRKLDKNLTGQMGIKMTTSMYDYNHYKITVRLAPDGLSGLVAVFDPRYPRDGALYRTTSLDHAMRWIDAYRDGQQWAVDSMQRAVIEDRDGQQWAVDDMSRAWL
jgi:hypothetical protein